MIIFNVLGDKINSVGIGDRFINIRVGIDIVGWLGK